MSIDLTNYFLDPKTSNGQLRFEEGWDIYEHSSVHHKRLDRVQAVIGEGRYAILVRHYEHGHWCGYVPVLHPVDFHAKERLIRAAIHPRISFVGYGNEWINWCATDSKGKLTVPIKIVPTADPKGVYWVGFNLYKQEVDSNVALSLLYSFEQVLNSHLLAP